MTIFDAVIIIILLLSTGLAVARGALLELATLVVLGIAGLVSLRLIDPVASALGKDGSVIATLLIFAGLTALLFTIFYIIVHLLHLKFPLSRKGTTINRIAGGVFGFMRGYVLIGLMFLAYGYYQGEADQHHSVRSALLKPIAAHGASIFAQFIPESAHIDLNSDSPKDEINAATEGYGRSDRATLSEVITTVTTSQSDQDDNSKPQSPQSQAPGTRTHDPDQQQDQPKR